MLGVGVSAADMVVNGINTSNSLDLAFGFIGLIPGGQGISLAYFMINTGFTVMTGKNIGQHIDEW